MGLFGLGGGSKSSFFPIASCSAPTLREQPCGCTRRLGDNVLPFRVKKKCQQIKMSPPHSRDQLLLHTDAVMEQDDAWSAVFPGIWGCMGQGGNGRTFCPLWDNEFSPALGYRDGSDGKYQLPTIEIRFLLHAVHCWEGLVAEVSGLLPDFNCKGRGENTKL